MEPAQAFKTSNETDSSAEVSTPFERINSSHFKQVVHISFASHGVINIVLPTLPPILTHTSPPHPHPPPHSPLSDAPH